LIEIGEVETHFTLPGRGDFDQPAAPRETVDGAAEHDAANNIEDDINLSPSRGITRLSFTCTQRSVREVLLFAAIYDWLT
jgi:hypothetical protein